MWDSNKRDQLILLALPNLGQIMNKSMNMTAIDAQGEGMPGDTSGALWVLQKMQGKEKFGENRKNQHTIDGVEDRSLAVGVLVLCGAVADIVAKLRATTGRVVINFVRLNVGRRKALLSVRWLVGEAIEIIELCTAERKKDIRDHRDSRSVGR